MSKAPTDAELGAALRVILSAMGGTAAASPPSSTTSTAASKPADKPAAGGAAQEEKAPETIAVSPEAFSKAMIDKVKLANGGAKAGGPVAKAVLAEYGVETFSAIPEDKREAFTASLDDAIATHNLG